MKAARTLGDILIESALIVFSILLALGVNQWADHRNREALQRHALESIASEIHANQARVADALHYHRLLLEQTRLADTNGKIGSFAQWRAAVPAFKGFHNPDLEDTAWETALSTGAIKDLPFDRLAALSGAYSYQKRLDGYNSASIAAFDFSDQAMAGTARKVYIYLATVVPNEEALENRYKSAFGQSQSAE